MLVPLLVDPDSPDAFDAALRSGAGALVLDLGDAAAPGRRRPDDRPARRARAAELLARRPRGSGAPTAIVRVAPLASGLVDADLDAVMPGAPEAVLLPGAVGARDLQHLAAKLAVREAEHGLPAGRTRIIAMAADTAAGALALSALAHSALAHSAVPGAGPRLSALGWDAAAFAAALGVGADASPVRSTRDLLLVAAAAAGVPALDLTALDFTAPAATAPAATAPAGDLVTACDDARRDGFAGRLARSPGEVPAIRGRFDPLRPGRGS